MTGASLFAIGAGIGAGIGAIGACTGVIALAADVARAAGPRPRAVLPAIGRCAR